MVDKQENDDKLSESIDDILGILQSEPNIKNMTQQKDQKQFIMTSDQLKENIPSQGQLNNIPNQQENLGKKQNLDDYDTLLHFCDEFEKQYRQKESKIKSQTITQQCQKSGNDNKNQTLKQFSKQTPNQTQQVYNQVNVLLQKGNAPIIRYLQFKSWSGKDIQAPKDYGYYYQFFNGPQKLIKGVLEENGFKETNSNDWTIVWTSGTIRHDIFQQLMAYQKVNQFPRSIEITRKDLMCRNLSKMKQQFGPIAYNFFPKTFILPAEQQMFLEDTEKEKNQDIWYICKPAGSSQGKGIFITDKIQEIIGRQVQGQSTVVSHYIKNPLLINDLKFDLRIYVGVTCIHPLKIYIYEEGLARFATSQYNKNIEFAENKDASVDYAGSKWSLTALKDFLSLNGIKVDQLFEKIDDMIVKTIISIENTIYGSFEMQVPFRNNCFEVFGFDVLIDENLKPWLLEVNLSPSLNTDTPLDLKIKGNMISDLITLIGIVPLDQRYGEDNSYNFTLNNLSNDKNYANIVNKQKNSANYNKDLTNLEKYIIKESDDELKRARKFRRLFPTSNSIKYKNFFEIDRPFNILLRNHELSKQKQNSANNTYSQQAQEKNLTTKSNFGQRQNPERNIFQKKQN